jgi:putative ABC transport system permease protein
VAEVLVPTAGFREMMGLEMVQGEWFSGTPADSARFILNETAVRAIGMNDPIGKRFILWQREGVIAGVVRDFHAGSVREKIPPIVISPAQNGVVPTILFVKTTSGDAQACVAAVESQWKKFNPRYPFEYRFLDETFDKLHREEARLGRLLDAFALVAVLLCVLGLLGLAAFTAERRTKEIGIRKVLGASVAGIVALLAKDFLKLVVVAVFIATPIAYWAMHRWLGDFAYRIDIEWWMFVAAGATAAVVAFLTVGFQSAKAATTNPVKSLRSE